MPVKLKVVPVEKFTQVAVRNMARPEQQRAIATFVRGRIAETDNINRRVLGRVPPRTITVDGSKTNLAGVIRVNPDRGKIIVEYELTNEVLRWIGETLVQRSPVRSGRYVDSHLLFADGKVVTPGQIPPAEEYVFLNPVPYARKLEIGKTKSGRPFLIQVQNRIYERTAKDARSRFSKTNNISFTYRKTTAAYTLKRGYGNKKDRQKGAAVTAPAIVVRHKT